MMLTKQIAKRARRELGIYRAADWERFMLDHGLLWTVVDCPMPVPAFRCGNVIFFARHLSMSQRCEWAWHEISHTILHCGNSRWWKSRPQGHITVSKFEQQAVEFALLYPMWE